MTDAFAPGDDDIEVVHYGPDIATEAGLRLLGPLEGKRVLELGGGTGATAVAMAKQGARVIAVTESAEQLTSARQLADREDVKVELHQGDLADLAFVRADTVDVALSVYALATVSDLGRVFRQVHRVLRPEAPFVLSLPHPAFRVVDGDGDPPAVLRTYFDPAPRNMTVGATSRPEYPTTIEELFTGLGRANFRVDALVEPEPPRAAPRSRHWRPAMRWMPSTLIVRARKQGT